MSSSLLFSSSSSSVLLLSTLVISVIASSTAATTTTFISHCPPSPLYTSNSSYHGNLKLLLSSMASSPTTFNSTQGQPPYEIFSRAVCFDDEDQNSSTCKTCMKKATSDVLMRCPNRKRAVWCLPGCALAYSDRRELLPVISPRLWSPARRLLTSARNETSSAAGTTEGERKKQGPLVMIAVVAVAVVVALVVLGIAWCRRRRSGNADENPSERLVTFDSKVLKKATNNFHKSNLLGCGGFGFVYKGVLQNRQEVAVKRLSEGSIQRIKELTIEVVVLSRLRHHNLVKVLGYCFEEKERMLVYEYLPNRSLDKILSDPERRQDLTWATRFRMIKEIGEGIFYLHNVPHARIIHRDLKSANILLDKDMTAKISDFGLAKLFDDKVTHAITSKVAGTLGYMAPEYFTKGVYSTKTDVFSYGIIILEIVTGRMSFSFQGTHDALLRYVTENWNQGTAMQALDPELRGACSRDEVMASLFMGLSCAQEEPKARPEMGTVLQRLSEPTATSRMPSVTFKMPS